jgi:hypothetical protein
MWIILFAILLLFLLVFMNGKREGFNSSQLLDIYKVLTDDTTGNDEKIKLLADPSFTINDSAVENIVKSEMFSDNEKIIKIYAYLDELIDKRNDKLPYANNDKQIEFDHFFHILKIIQSSDYDDDTEKILEIKKLGLIDTAFDAVTNNNNITDSLKIINADNPKQPSLQKLINEIIYPV